MHEIILPETKPALEWVNGRVLQKVSPQRKHALAQMEFTTALAAWAKENRCGMVGPEWEFRIQPPGEARRPLVPDVAYISYARLPHDDEAAADIPRVAPDAVVEVISPHDRPADIAEKVRVYLASGTGVVFLVDTEARLVTVRDGGAPRTISQDETIRHESLPGFALPARTLFDWPGPQGL